MNTHQASIGPDDLNRISDKIRKLMALAGNNPSEAEAAAAMAKAQELLASYNLDMAQLDQSTATADRDKRDAMGGGVRLKQKVERSAMFVFQRQLWQALAETNFCVYWATKAMASHLPR